MAKQTKFKIGRRTVILGESYYSATYMERYHDPENPTHNEPEAVVITEYVFRSARIKPGMQQKMAYFVAKIPGVTWVKLSRKHYDYGFPKNIPDYLCRAYLVAETQTIDLAATKAGAIRKEMANIRRGRPRRPDSFASTKEYKAKALARLKRELKKCTNHPKQQDK